MEVTIVETNIKQATSDSLNALMLWARYYENNPRLDYIKLHRTNGSWFIKVVLK